ncbi:MAG TPA: hypothetical protein VKY89_07350 [Thermoanaerobaculia bacterium]|jgi:hypothetical protein|nr:hypothetical protein [Thermoanaerobaculia bacterium]
MASPPAQVSVVAPLQAAIEHVRRLLFRPFALATWCTIGFCAWLAGLGGAQFTWMNPQVPLSRGGQDGSRLPSWQGASEAWEQVRDEVMRNLYWILPLAATLACLIAAFCVLMIWLSSRGEFMFLHCVALGRAEVAVPWRQHARKARSLFLFRLALGLIAAVLLLSLLATVVVFVVQIVRQGATPLASLLPLLAAGLALVVIGIGFGVIAKLTRDFVVPIMFLRDGTCREAWRELLGLFAGGFHLLVLYLLFQIVLALAIGIVVLAAVIASCCIAGCLLVLPYVGTVFLLPVLVFQRAYSIYYLAQLGPQVDLFRAAATPPATPA